MPLNETLLIALVILAALVLLLQVAVLLRGRGDPGLGAKLDTLKDDSARVERTLREEQRAWREELQQGFDRFRGHLGEQLGGMSQQQAERIDSFGQRLAALTDGTSQGLQTLAQQLTEDARKSRAETTLALNHFGEQQQQRFAALSAEHEKRMGEVRATLEAKLGAIQQDNAAKLEQMRATVDEKLQSTLETRLGQSFQLVSERLEAVQRGLGEMQNLAIGVGDLKRVLTNVKSRGILGEVQLGALLEQMLTAEQYESNVITVPGSNERVEFAIRMPGQGEGEHILLPIDAKFPMEDYQRLLEAQENADIEAAGIAGRALEIRVREEARRIKGKYIAPPHTTDFAVLFLPTEGL
ncbi:MAG: DNA recombination protein RmuC, partial [Rhodanobacter sp.]